MTSLGAAVLLVLAWIAPGIPAAAAGSAPAGWRSVSYAGESFDVPARWTTFDTATDPSACVRFDRHALYLGGEARHALCPTQAVGVEAAAQVERVSVAPPGLVASELGGQPVEIGAHPQVERRSVAWFPDTGVEVTVTWGDQPAIARELLDSFHPTGGSAPVSGGLTTRAGSVARSASGAPPVPMSAPVSSSAAGSAPGSTKASSVGSGQVGPAVADVLGFDACGAPSTQTMSSWLLSSPYRAIGVYLGGANAACGGEGLSSSWVQTETSAGWDLIPIYVGLQAACAFQKGLAPIDAVDAGAEGAAAAEDAVSEAVSFGLAPGSPIYYDMEAWNTADATCSQAVIAFIESWTTTLHVLGYSSGMYGSADAGLAQDIVPLYGQTGAPDDLWFADWDGSTTVTSSYIPPTAWPAGSRLKQYSGNVTETYGGATLAIDQDSITGAVVGLGQPIVAAMSEPAGAPGSQVEITGAHFATDSTTVDFGGVPSPQVDVISSGTLLATVPATVPGPADVTVTTGGGGTSASVPAEDFSVRADVAAASDPLTGGYWATTAEGNVANVGSPWYGSAVGAAPPGGIVGIAADPATGGYWVVSADGNVYHYHAPWWGSPFGRAPAGTVTGIAADPATGGYWVVTSAGNVYQYHAPWLGSPYGHLPPGSTVTGIAADPATGGYWVVTSAGNVLHYHAPWFGSPFGALASGATVVGLAADPASSGYWLATDTGGVYGYGAPSLGGWSSTPPTPVVAILPNATGYELLTAGGATQSVPPTTTVPAPTTTVPTTTTTITTTTPTTTTTTTTR